MLTNMIKNLGNLLRELEAALEEALPALEALPAHVLPGAPHEKLRRALPLIKATRAACNELTAPGPGGRRTGPGSLIGRNVHSPR